jgi:hypothetical protein
MRKYLGSATDERLRKKGDNHMRKQPSTSSERVQLRMTPEDKSLLAEKAKSARLSVTDFILRLAKNKKIIVVDKLPHLILEITRIGVNINQIAHVANSKKTVNETQIKFICEQQGEIRKILKDILREFHGDDESEETLRAEISKSEEIIKAEKERLMNLQRKLKRRIEKKG